MIRDVREQGQVETPLLLALDTYRMEVDIISHVVHVSFEYPPNITQGGMSCDF